MVSVAFAKDNKEHMSIFKKIDKLAEKNHRSRSMQIIVSLLNTISNDKEKD